MNKLLDKIERYLDSVHEEPSLTWLMLSALFWAMVLYCLIVAIFTL